MQQLRKIAENLWVAEQDLVLAGINMGARMTLVRLSNGDIWINSPIRISGTKLKSQIQEIGSVKYIVAPNNFHSAFLSDCSKNFPTAEVWATSSVQKKRNRINFSETLSGSGTYPWNEEILTCGVEGMPWFQEHVFFHRSSNTLILTDMLFNHQGREHLWERIFCKINCCGSAHRPSRIFRSFIFDRKKFAKSLLPLFTLEKIDHIIIAHGELIHSDCLMVFKNAFESK